MLKKEQILRLIYNENIMRTAHDHLADSLVGGLHHEYTGQWPTTPAAQIRDIRPLPIFRAIVDMLIAQMLHHFAETIIERIVDIIVKYQEENHE